MADILSGRNEGIVRTSQEKMFVTKKPFILASASPRRRRFLENLGIDFTIHVADVDEKTLVRMMIGRTLDVIFPEKGKGGTEIILSVHNLTRAGASGWALND